MILKTISHGVLQQQMICPTGDYRLQIRAKPVLKGKV
jgi:hypothetical protein